MLKALWVHLNIFIAVLISTIAVVFGYLLFLQWTTDKTPLPVVADVKITPTPTPTPLINATRVLMAISDHRRRLGLSELQEDVDLCQIAGFRATEIKTRGDGSSRSLSHAGFEKYVDMYPGQFVGENLLNPAGLSDYSPERVLAVWLGSPEHKSLIEKKLFTEGCVVSNNSVVVLIMGQP